MSSTLDFKDIFEDYEEFLNESLVNFRRFNLVKPSTVDVLELTLPIKEYEEYDSCLENVTGAPHYQLKLKNVSRLIQHKAELIGREFQVPGFDDLSAQIKCNIEYDDFQFSIRFSKLTSFCGKFDENFNPIVITALKANDADSNENVCRVFPFGQQLFYDQFYPIFTLFYGHCLKRCVDNNEDSLTLPLFVRNGFLHDLEYPDDECFLWKVDASHLGLKEGARFKNEKQMAFSPFFCDEKGIVKVQLRLFLIGDEVEAEARFFNQNFHSHQKEKIRVTSRMSVSLIHPSRPTERVSVTFETVVSSSKKTTKIVALADIDQLVTFISDNKLLLTVEVK